MAKELTNEEKARSVLCRTGSVGNSVASLTPEELTQLAKIYDECCAPELLLTDRIKAFWDTRQDLLDKQKATDDLQSPNEAAKS